MIRKSKMGQVTKSTQAVMCGYAHVWPIHCHVVVREKRLRTASLEKRKKMKICLLRTQIYPMFMLSI